MIRNLNQMTFQGFGTVPPERNQSAKFFDKNSAETLMLSDRETTVCRAVSDTWVTCGSGSSVLSVSQDGERFQQYYLDKPVCIKAGIYFGISAFMGGATALCYAQQLPEQVRSQGIDAITMAHKVRVDNT